MIFATFDINGNPTGFYNSEIHGKNIPPHAIDISVADHWKYVSEPGRWIRGSSGAIIEKPVALQSLDDIKNAKLAELKNSFMSECQGGTCDTSLGFPMDARRDGINNDLDNMIQLAIFMEENGIASTKVMDANDVEHTCTLAQVQTLVSDIRAAGMSRYAKKFTLKNQTKAATTADQVTVVKW